MANKNTFDESNPFELNHPKSFREFFIVRDEYLKVRDELNILKEFQGAFNRSEISEKTTINISNLKFLKDLSNNTKDILQEAIRDDKLDEFVSEKMEEFSKARNEFELKATAINRLKGQLFSRYRDVLHRSKTVAKATVESAKYTVKQAVKGTKYTVKQTVKGTKYTVDKTVEGTKYAAKKTVEGTKYAAKKTVEGTKYAADKTVEGTKYAADKTVAGTKYAAKKTVEGTKYAADKTVEGTKYAAKKTAEGTKYAATETYNSTVRPAKNKILSEKRELGRIINSAKDGIANNKQMNEMVKDKIISDIKEGGDIAAIAINAKNTSVNLPSKSEILIYIEDKIENTLSKSSENVELESYRVKKVDLLLALHKKIDRLDVNKNDFDGRLRAELIKYNSERINMRSENISGIVRTGSGEDLIIKGNDRSRYMQVKNSVAKNYKSDDGKSSKVQDKKSGKHEF